MMHAALAAGRWQTMSLAEQLGNIGSEFDRALNWRQRDAPDKFESALARFIELMNLTIADPRWKGLRRRELARVKEQTISLLLDDKNVDSAPLQNYFTQFAFLARGRRPI